MPEPILHVEFDQPDEVFFPGHPVSGRVTLLTTDQYKARAVNIKFEGRAHTFWEDTERTRQVDAEGKTNFVEQKVNYSSNVTYLESSNLLWACRDGTNELAAGKYVWPFSYVLPANIPPSFEGKYGYIRYSVTAEVDRPWRFDKAKKRCITGKLKKNILSYYFTFPVSPLIDLNTLPQAMTPLRDQASENLGCCCFKKGYLEMRVDIPKTGFVPGETVPINLHILNHSSVPVIEVRAKIIQQCKFVGFRRGVSSHQSADEMTVSPREMKHVNNDIIKQIKDVFVKPREEHKMALSLLLPSVTPTIKLHSPVITVEYLVQISVDTTSTFGSDVDSEFSLLIGTVPIRQFLPPAYYPPNPALPPAMPTPLPPQIEGGVIGTLPPYPETASSFENPNNVVIPRAPPISYQDSMYGATGTELNADENEKPFVPKYPVFNGLPVYNPSAPSV